VNDFGLAGGSEFVANPQPTNAFGSDVLAAFVYKNGRFTTIPPTAGLCTVLGDGANDLGVLAIEDWNADGSAVFSSLVIPGF